MKDYEVKRKDKDMPPLYDTFPTSTKVRKEPVTNVSIPTDEAVDDVKRWSETNRK